MDENKTESVKQGILRTPKCRYCHGTGFKDGQVCSCITGAKPEIPQALKDIFGGVFMDKKRGE